MRTRSREYWEVATKAPGIGSGSKVGVRPGPGSCNCHNYRRGKDQASGNGSEILGPKREVCCSWD